MSESGISARSFEAERAELRAVLSSEAFQRAPTLAQLLDYVSEQYFRGKAQSIKEYNIAVEALGRPPDFDPKKDSIVRVEAYRLRKRLREYYDNEGRSHPIRIELPSGAYVPVFVRQHTGPEPGSGDGSSGDGSTAARQQEPPAAAPEGRPRGPARRAFWIEGAGAVLAFAAAWLVWIMETPEPGPATARPGRGGRQQAGCGGDGERDPDRRRQRGSGPRQRRADLAVRPPFPGRPRHVSQRR